MRLVTRGDLDGATSAVLITTMEEIDAIELVHPQDITDRKVEITGNDILANLPYDSRCGMWFDHHVLTESNESPPESFKGKHDIAPSVARVIYDYYASEKLEKYVHLIQETDRFDSAQLTREDVLNPQEVILLGYTVDSRSGLGRFKEYFLQIVEWLKTMPVDRVLDQPEVKKRVEMLRENDLAVLGLLKKHSRQEGNVVITDLRGVKEVPIGNRFLIYTLFPETNVSLRLQWGPGEQFVAATLGHNIFNRTSNANCGQICSDFGGGGHRGAGACPLPASRADEQISEIIARLRESGASRSE